MGEGSTAGYAVAGYRDSSARFTPMQEPYRADVLPSNYNPRTGLFFGPAAAMTAPTVQRRPSPATERRAISVRAFDVT